MALLVALAYVSVVASLAGAIDLCGPLHENAECVSECPTEIGYVRYNESYLCTTGVCCKPPTGSELTTPAPGTFNPGPDTCGVPGDGRVKRSITGGPSRKCIWPWLVSIRMGLTDSSIPVSHVMTGVLVSNKAVLVYKKTYEILANILKDIEAVVGDYYLNMNGDEQHIFSVKPNKTFGEFLLIELSEAVQFSACVRPICLSDAAEYGSLDMSQCKLIGWGHTDAGTGRLTLAPVPLHDNVTILNSDTCTTLLSLITDEPAGELLCLNSDTPNKIPIIPQGDVGNPIMCPNGHRQWHLKGILARGNYDVGTEPTSYPIAVDVMSIVQQIKEAI